MGFLNGTWFRGVFLELIMYLRYVIMLDSNMEGAEQEGTDGCRI